MGEYWKGINNNKQQPFWIIDVQFFIVWKPYNTATAPQ